MKGDEVSVNCNVVNLNEIYFRNGMVIKMCFLNMIEV